MAMTPASMGVLTLKMATNCYQAVAAVYRGASHPGLTSLAI